MFDIAIIGAGPAGAALARLLPGQYRILLVERCGEDSAGKCCGGLLGPDAQRALARIGLSLPAALMADPQIFAVQAVDLPAGREGLYPRHYLNIKRGAFDRWLLSLLPPSVDRRDGCLLKSLEKAADGYQLHLAMHGRAYKESARVLIGADGANSLVRRLVRPGGLGGRAYLAYQEYYEAAAISPYYTAIFDPAVTDYYAWAIPKDGCLILGAALRPDGGAMDRFALLTEKLAGRGWRFGRLIRREGARLLRPGGDDICLGRENIALIGEAAGFISPSSGEGIGFALRSAACLAASLARGTEGFLRRYAEETARLRREIALKRLKAPFLYQPILRRSIIGSGAGQIRGFAQTRWGEAF